MALFAPGTPTWQKVVAITVPITAVAAVGLLIWGIIALTSSEDTTATGPNSKSVCGLDQVSGVMPPEMPETTWTPEEPSGTARPSSVGLGPGREDNGIHSCFAHTPTGAVLAAANLAVDGITSTAKVDESWRGRYSSDPTTQKVFDEMVAAATEPAEATSTLQIAGYEVQHSSMDQVDLDLWVTVTAGANVGVEFSLPQHLVWEDGDWRVRLESLDAEPNRSKGSSFQSWGPMSPTTEAMVGPVLTGSCSGNPADWLNCAGDAVDSVTSLPGDAVGSVALSAWNSMVDAFVDGANWALKNLMTLWMEAPDPTVGGSTTTWINTHTHYLVLAVMVGCIMWTGLRLALYSQARDMVNLGEAMVRTILVSTAMTMLVSTGLWVADQWSQWILDEAELDLSKEVLASARMVSVVLLVVGLIVVVTQLIQLALMIIRNATIVLLSGTITLAAAGSGTQVGKAAFHKQISWLVAFILYKPAAALIYATSFKMASQDDLMDQLTGITMMVLAVFTLPALMRLIVPITATLGGANAGAIAGATVGAGIAMGAMAAAPAGAFAGSGAGGFMGGAGQTSRLGGGPSGAVGGASGSGGGTGGGSAGPVPGGLGGSSSSGGGDDSKSLSGAVGGAATGTAPSPGGASGWSGTSGGGTAGAGAAAGGGPSGAPVGPGGSSSGSSSSGLGAGGGSMGAPSGAPLDGPSGDSPTSQVTPGGASDGLGDSGSAGPVASGPSGSGSAGGAASGGGVGRAAGAVRNATSGFAGGLSQAVGGDEAPPPATEGPAGAGVSPSE